MEIAQRWSEFGDFAWGFLEEGAFYPLNTSKEFVEESWRHIAVDYYPGYFREEEWSSDSTHFTLTVHPADLPQADPKKFTVIEKPKTPRSGRFFREDDE